MGNLVYDARHAEEINLIPLGKGSKLSSAREFYDQLWRDAEHERKLKKRNQLSGLHKLVEICFRKTADELCFAFVLSSSKVFNIAARSRRVRLSV